MHILAVAVASLASLVTLGFGGLTLVFGGESMENLYADMRRRHETALGVVLLCIGCALAIGAYAFS